jgi:hypothetical protein
MKLKDNEVVLSGRDGRIHIKRNLYGIPEIKAETLADLNFGLGWVHACDRQLQVLLSRILLQGKAAEHIKGDPTLIEIDKYMRRMNFLPDPESEINKLKPDIRRQLEAYAAGCNLYLSENKPVHEFRLLGYKPEPWHIRDSMLIEKIFGFIGLADSQGTMEKFLIQMIQNGVTQDKLRELFPYLTEEIDYDLIGKVKLDPPLVPEAVAWLRALPVMTASNNWAVSGRRTESGKPILCGDPHLEVNRLPPVWQEIVMRLPDNTMTGATIPGVPGLILGRTAAIAWSATYAFMDMLDYRIEHCRDGKYRRADGWKDFKVRREVIHVKKGSPITLDVYENEHGLLEGDPTQEGYYLVQSWSAKAGCGADDFATIFSLPGAKNVREAMGLFKQVDAAAMNWVMADKDGNIGYQMSGRLFSRVTGFSGMLPLPGWEMKFDPAGFADKDGLPSQYNPEDGVIVTANQDLNQAELVMEIAEGIIFRVNAKDGGRPHIFFSRTPLCRRVHPGPGMFVQSRLPLSCHRFPHRDGVLRLAHVNTGNRQQGDENGQPGERGIIRAAYFQHPQGRPRTAMVAAGFHGLRQILGAAQGAHHERQRHGGGGFDPLQQGPCPHIRAPGRLRRPDPVEFLQQRRHKTQGHRDHYGNILRRDAQAFKGTQHFFKAADHLRRGRGHRQDGAAQHKRKELPGHVSAPEQSLIGYLQAQPGDLVERCTIREEKMQ